MLHDMFLMTCYFYYGFFFYCFNVMYIKFNNKYNIHNAILCVMFLNELIN